MAGGPSVCWKCHGRGGFRGPGGRWNRCDCMKPPSKTVRQMMQDFNARPDHPFQLPLYTPPDDAAKDQT